MAVLAACLAWAMVNRPPAETAVIPGAQVEGVTSILARDFSGDVGEIRFEDVTELVGVKFRHFPAVRESLLPEDMGSGVAVGDYDNDGYDDLYFVNFAGSILTDVARPAQGGESRLFRNVGGERFEDVTESAGVGFVGFGMAAAWGDYDNDNDLDLYVTALGANVLYENLGDGTFRDVTERAGIQDDRYSAGCCWADYDRDGDLDLYVCNYVNWVFRPQDRGVRKRQYATEQPYTLNPSAYQPVSNSLFRNNGDGTFAQVAEEAGVADPNGRSLAAAWVDMDNDGWVDIYIANDVSNNGVFRNRGDGTFEDVGPGSLAADYRGAMGIAVSDFDDDLDQDILITHWIAQENALYRNMLIDAMLGAPETERLWFLDAADELGLGQISLDMVGWSTGFADFDNDGRRDLWLINGSTFEQPENLRLLKTQRPFLFRNIGETGFADVGASASPAFTQTYVGRGGVQLDFDHDGRIDLVWLIHGGEAVVLKNTTPAPGNYLRVKLAQIGGNTAALGARVFVDAGDRIQMAEVGTASSYLSQHEATQHFGLGEADMVRSLRIVWPDGAEEMHDNVPVNQTVHYTHEAHYPVQ